MFKSKPIKELDDEFFDKRRPLLVRGGKLRGRLKQEMEEL